MLPFSVQWSSDQARVFNWREEGTYYYNLLRQIQTYSYLGAWNKNTYRTKYLRHKIPHAPPYGIIKTQKHCTCMNSLILHVHCIFLQGILICIWWMELQFELVVILLCNSVLKRLRTQTEKVQSSALWIAEKLLLRRRRHAITIKHVRIWVIHFFTMEITTQHRI